MANLVVLGQRVDRVVITYVVPSRIELAEDRAMSRLNLVEMSVFFSWQSFGEAQTRLLLGEALVSGEANGGSAEEDAAVGVMPSSRNCPDLGDANALDTRGPLAHRRGGAWIDRILPGQVLLDGVYAHRGGMRLHRRELG
jgi:hypothetical protein